MECAPLEVLHCIFERLDPSSRVSATLSCQRWKSILSPSLPKLAHLHVNLDSLACEGKILYRSACDTSTAICQCSEHAVDQGVFLKEIFQLFGDQLRSVLVEDSLFSRHNPEDERVQDYPIHVILRECQSLSCIEFNTLDMREIKLWTLALLAHLTALTAIRFTHCRFPSDMNESLLLRLLASSFGVLEELRITGSDTLVTDKLCFTVAKRCPHLREIDVSGCKRITALSVIAFCEALAANPDAVGPLIISVRGTSFSPAELSRHLHNPLLQCGAECWEPKALTLTIGFDRQAIVLTNRERNHLSILIYL